MESSDHSENRAQFENIVYIQKKQLNQDRIHIDEIGDQNDEEVEDDDVSNTLLDFYSVDKMKECVFKIISIKSSNPPGITKRNFLEQLEDDGVMKLLLEYYDCDHIHMFADLLSTY